MKWDPKEDDMIMEMVQKGYSAAQIGKELGRSKNSIIGRLHRLRMSLMPKVKVKAIVKSKGNYAAQAVYDLKAHECKWPEGDPLKKGFHFCCAPRRLGHPYCEKHISRMYR